MTKLSQKQKIKLNSLFQQNKFSDLEHEIESISNFKNRSSFLANLLGVVKLKKPSVSQIDFEQARELFKDSYEKDPSYIDAMCNLGHVSLKLRNFDYIFRKLKDFRKKEGYNKKIYETLARIFYFLGDVDDALSLFKEIADRDDLSSEGAANFLTSLNYSSSFSQTEYLNYCKKINKKFAPQDLEKLIELQIDKNSKDLNIGFISPDFRDHSVSEFLFGTLEELKNRGFKIHAFNLRKIEELDPTSHSLMEVFDGWHNLADLSDLDAANEIRKNKINILIDLVGYFSRNRFIIMKYKPAPIQILWLGYINTMGIKEVDYIVADPNLIYDNEKNLYSEKIIKLPNIWNCHSGINFNIASQDPPFLKNNYITFGCFNNSSKITHDVIKTWSRILLKKDNSKIIIKAPSEDSEIAQENILKKFESFNIDGSRILFFKRKKKKKEHYKLYNEVDITLDTFPYPGVTTSMESIWMGVPVLTLKGNNFVSRCGESINLNLKMPELIAKNKDEYVSKALSLSKDIKNLNTIRKSLRQKALDSPLFNIKKFGKQFEEMLKNVWSNYLLK
jgi:protein O-GlcNAc transferase